MTILHYAWLFDDLVQRQNMLELLSGEEEWALNTLSEHQNKDVSIKLSALMSKRERERLMAVSLLREAAIGDEEELAQLLDMQESGIPINEDRCYYLDLLTRKRRGEDLEPEEETDLAAVSYTHLTLPTKA